jgi:hypothetical protein
VFSFFLNTLSIPPRGGFICIFESVQAKQTHCGPKLCMPGVAGLAAGSHARRPALNEIREFRKTMPRPRRGSELVFRGPPAAKSSWRCPHTHTTTGGPHVSRISARPVASLATWSGASCGATWRSRHPPCTKRACSHNWTSREPVFAAGKEEILAQRISKGLMLPACLLSSLALSSDGVLYLLGR